jgi:hypothetical protein
MNEPLDDEASYYDVGGIEVFQILRAKLTPEQFEGFILGNIIKYVCRLNFKGNKEEDIRKARIYAEILDSQNTLKGKKENE